MAPGTEPEPGEVANLGLARPPLVYGSAIAAGWALDFAWPIALLPDGRIGRVLGSVLVLGGLVLFFTAVRAFRRAGTPVPGNRPTTVIVRTGPYRFSRNPIYLAFSLLQLGIAGWLNSVWLVATLVLAIALLAAVVIPREERYLERKFGSQYLDYKAAVRRWI